MIKLLQVAILVLFWDELYGLPNDIEKCRINDEQCLIRSSNKVLRKYYGGITEIDLPSLDPFIVDKVDLTHDYGVIKARGYMYNVKAHGYSAATIIKFSGIDKNLIELHFKVPVIKFTGFYKGRGELLSIPLQGTGPFTVNFYDFLIRLKIKLERYTRNGKEYFRAVDTDISSTVRTGDLDLPEVGRAVNWILNTSFDVVLKSSMKSYIGDVWSKLYEKRFNDVFNKVPIQDLFLVRYKNYTILSTLTSDRKS
ncbi:circadian clock-controlled protein daywake-like [Chironomus tepperi]|uniref:circadian clock-controlled protein daywake-like n=1 Tax=Chironomus tepperi TaxID=113505 RepID=UPI00391F8935